MPRGATATIVFTDLVGSTDLLSRLGEAGFDALRRAHFSALQRAVETAGGEQVKTLGDGMLAVFPSAADAVACAVAVQQAADGQTRSGSAPVAVRVGVALGDVSFEDGDVFGAPVVEAARLVAAAGAGQILCTHLVRAVAGGRSGAVFTDAGLLALKGLPEPVAVCEVAWEPIAGDAAEPVPLPALLTGTGRIFVGREGELDRLGRLWKEVSTGERRVALLGGEPGIGKTCLAAEQAARVHADGAVVLAGRCDEDLGVPFQPFVEALRHYAGHAAERRLGRHPGELVRLVPELAQLVPALPDPLRSDPETERYRLFDAVASWLADLSTDTPVALVLDDLQWAAKPTLLLLRHVLRHPDPIALLVIATYRDTDLGRGHPLAELLADLRRVGGMERIVLAGLDRESVEAYIEAAAGHALPVDHDGFARAVFEETDGHPFFVAELLRHLAESGAIEKRDGRWVATTEIEALGIPEGVRDVIGRRLSRLSGTANRVLALASVAGLEFEVEVVRAAGALEEDELFSALEEAIVARLVSEVPGVRYRFAHGLVRTTLYDELSGARRVSLHRRVAEAIETVHLNDLDNHLPALAHHWARAAAPAAESAKAVEYATRSGDQALAQLAHDQAAAYYRQSLGLLDATGVAAEDGRRLELLISLGEAQRRAGDPGYRETLLEAANLARQHRDAPALARAALANNRGFHSAAERIDAERVQVLEAALESIPSDDSGIQARLLASLATELGWEADGRRRLTLACEALAMARRLADLPTLGQVLALRMTVVPHVAPVEAGAEIAELETVAHRLQDPALAFWAAIWGFQMALQFGDTVWFSAALESAGARAAELNQPFLEWCSTMTRTTQSLVHGRLDEAEESALHCFEIGQSAGIPDASYVFGAQRFWILHERGRLEELISTLAKATARPDPNALTRAAFAVALGELGRRDEARAVIDDLAADGFASLPSNYSALYGLTLAAGGCAAAGHVAGAATLKDRLGPHRGLIAQGGAVATGSVDHFVGLLALTLGDLDEAEIHFREAARIHESFGAPTWLARTRLEWARMLLTRGGVGDHHRARSLLRQAVTTATDLGLANVERDARALLEDAPLPT